MSSWLPKASSNSESATGVAAFVRWWWSELTIASMDSSAFRLRSLGDIPCPGKGRPRRRPGDRSQTRGAVLLEGETLPRLSESSTPILDLPRFA